MSFQWTEMILWKYYQATDVHPYSAMYQINPNNLLNSSPNDTWYIHI
jgi:hypothetical protein